MTSRPGRPSSTCALQPRLGALGATARAVTAVLRGQALGRGGTLPLPGDVAMQTILRRLAVFVFVLLGLKVLVHLPISILGSLVLTLVLAIMFTLLGI